MMVALGASARSRFLCCVFVLLACGHAACLAADEPLPGKGDTIIARHTDQPITIDGTLDEKAWQTAAPFPLKWRARREKYKIVGGDELDDPTVAARFLWDDENLYVAAVCRDEKIACSFTARDADLWKEDVVELFVKPRTDSAWYWEYEWNPRGQLLDLRWQDQNTRDDVERAKQWNSPCVMAVQVDGTLDEFEDTDRSWQIEVRIPFTDFAPVIKQAPKAGDQWQATLCSYNYAFPVTARVKGNRPATYLSSPSKGPHDWEGYSALQFKR